MATSQRSIRSRRAIWIADAHRDGKRFIVSADELLIEFVELESAIRGIVASTRPVAENLPRI
jgi:hypothetical protein